MGRIRNVLGIVVLLMFVISAGNVYAVLDLWFIPQKVIGEKARNFTLSTLRSDRFDFYETIAGKRSIVFFWTTWCPHCQKELKKINQISNEINKKDIILVFVSVGESKSAVKKYLESNRYDFDVVLDYKKSLTEIFPMQGIPTMFFIDDKGVIQFISHQFPKDYEKFFIPPDINKKT